MHWYTYSNVNVLKNQTEADLGNLTNDKLALFRDNMLFERFLCVFFCVLFICFVNKHFILEVRQQCIHHENISV